MRRLAILGFGVAFVALAFLPAFGDDFGKGAVRWYSLGFASVQPSEFLKPGFVVVAAWLMAASQQLGGPPGKTWSFALALAICAMLAMQPDFGQACLVLFAAEWLRTLWTIAAEIADATVAALEMDDRGFIPEFSVWATNPF